MTICLIGKNLTTLMLTKIFINEGLRVDLYDFNNKKHKKHVNKFEFNTNQLRVNFFNRNMYYVNILEKQAEYLDITLGLRTTMPKGWKFGDDPLARIKLLKEAA